MDNQYTNITKYYDLWVTSGYYDYETMAKEAHSILAQQKLKLNYIKQWKKEEVLRKAGFTFRGIHESQKFHIYGKS